LIGRRRRGGGLKLPTRAAEPVQASNPEPSRPRRREQTLVQDQAMYTCQCGYVFEAQVATSVGCPHCGTEQAW